MNRETLRANLAGLAAAIVIGGIIYLLVNPGYAVLSAAIGYLIGFATHREVLPEMAAGALKFGLMFALIGPGMDWLISGSPITRSLDKALVAGGMVGAVMGIRNARYSRRLLAKREASQQPDGSS